MPWEMSVPFMLPLVSSYIPCHIPRWKGMENSWNIGILYSRNVFRLAELYLLVKLSFLIEILY